MALMTKTDAKPPRGRRSTSKTSETEPGADPAGRSGRGKGAKGPKGAKEAGAAEPLVVTLPSTNLLPPAVAARSQADRLQKRFALGAAGAVAALAAVYLLQAGSISQANTDLETEQSRTAQLSAEKLALAPVDLFYKTLEVNRTTIQTTMAREVLLSDLTRRLYATAPSGVTLDTVGVTVDSQPVAATPGTAAAAGAAPAAGVDCPSPDPYAAPEERAGCVTISGSATSREALGRWESRVGRTDLFTDLFISDSQAGTAGGTAGTGDADAATAGDGITFTATLSVTAKAFTDRYADPEFLGGTSR